MLMTGYTKLFGSIVASTIWREDDKTRIVWITMLAIANKHGEVEASVPGLADLARVSVSECRAALEKLSAPDPDSRSMEYEGRRIEKVEGGWRLINHAKYREKLSTDERREYLAQKQREHRARQQVSTSVKSPKQESTSSTHTEAEAETKEEAEANPLPTASAGAVAKKKKEPAQTDEEWLAGLQTVLAYEHLNVAAEYSRAKVWCQSNNRQCTRRFFTNWLNRASANNREIAVKKPVTQQPAQPIDKRSDLEKHLDYWNAADALGKKPVDFGAWLRAGKPEN